MANTIMASGEGIRREGVVATGQTIYPGMLLAMNNSGQIIAHATEGGYAERMFAAEDVPQGKTVSDAYAAGSAIQYVHVYPGSEVYARIGGGQNIAIGDKLVSGGNGTLIEDSAVGSGVTVKQVVAIAREAYSASTAGLARVCVV